ncbi:hypothetical protein BDY19DRAFT_906630 [Irpex rosettiformis]|uniref:Uncharacterized protein n=1 Tax=Irpex rosettiformis TaxID=378272 RepID=A0ACB8U322_9APHY|nr:hypothetical protein BDY19DRAFT_906630 [Irpex rosettiformis]
MTLPAPFSCGKSLSHLFWSPIVGERSVPTAHTIRIAFTTATLPPHAGILALLDVQAGEFFAWHVLISSVIARKRYIPAHTPPSSTFELDGLDCSHASKHGRCVIGESTKVETLGKTHPREESAQTSCIDSHSTVYTREDGSANDVGSSFVLPRVSAPRGEHPVIWLVIAGADVSTDAVIRRAKPGGYFAKVVAAFPTLLGIVRLRGREAIAIAGHSSLTRSTPYIEVFSGSTSGALKHWWLSSLGHCRRFSGNLERDTALTFGPVLTIPPNPPSCHCEDGRSFAIYVYVPTRRNIFKRKSPSFAGLKLGT